ncbi:mos, partial [Symbiodinium microadriaticum]
VLRAILQDWLSGGMTSATLTLDWRTLLHRSNLSRAGGRRAHRPQRPMTDAEWAANMRRVLGPHLENMTSEVKSSWGPEVDPEAMLLRWLCQRHNLEVPPVSVRRRPKAEEREPAKPADSAEAAKPLEAPHSARAQPSSQPKQREPQPPNSARLPPIARHTEAKRAPEPRLGPGQSLPILEEESEGSPSPSPVHKTEPPAMALDLGVKALTTKPWKSNLSINLPECKPWSRTLQTVQDKIVSDERRHTSHSELLKANNQRMQDLMAYMHQEMRGQFLSKVPLLSDKVLDAKTQFRFGSQHVGVARVALQPQMQQSEMIADEPEKPEKPPVTFEGESEANRIVQEICNNAKVQEKVRVQVEAKAKAARAEIRMEKLIAKRYRYSSGPKDTEFWVKCQINDNDPPDFVHVLLTQEWRVKDVKLFERVDSKIHG